MVKTKIGNAIRIIENDTCIHAKHATDAEDDDHSSSGH